MRRGKLIAFEGTEGVGKTTQAARLVEWLNAHGIPAIFTREPGGAEGAELIRNLFLKREWADYRTEIMLTMASRMDHLKEKVNPALEEGTWVVSDRFTGSMRAYQGRSPEAVRFMLSLLRLCECPDPDLTIYLKMDVETALARARAKAKLNRYDEYDLDFHLGIRNTYDYLAERNPKTWLTIDADYGQEDVFQSVIIATRHCMEIKRRWTEIESQGKA